MSSKNQKIFKTNPYHQFSNKQQITNKSTSNQRCNKKLKWTFDSFSREPGSRLSPHHYECSVVVALWSLFLFPNGGYGDSHGGPEQQLRCSGTREEEKEEERREANRKTEVSNSLASITKYISTCSSIIMQTKLQQTYILLAAGYTLYSATHQVRAYVLWTLILKFWYAAYYAEPIVSSLAIIAVKCPIQISTSLLQWCARKEPFV